jgi:hypothetical protein
VLRSKRGIDSRQGAKLAKFGGESLVTERESFTVIFSDLCGLGAPSTLLRTCFAGDTPSLHRVLVRLLLHAARLKSLNSGTESFNLKNLTALPASMA